MASFVALFALSLRQKRAANASMNFLIDSKTYNERKIYEILHLNDCRIITSKPEARHNFSFSDVLTKDVIFVPFAQGRDLLNIVATLFGMNLGT
jgi:hypothetical protein